MIEVQMTIPELKEAMRLSQVLGFWNDYLAYEKELKRREKNA